MKVVYQCTQQRLVWSTNNNTYIIYKDKLIYFVVVNKLIRKHGVQHTSDNDKVWDFALGIIAGETTHQGSMLRAILVYSFCLHVYSIVLCGLYSADRQSDESCESQRPMMKTFGGL